MYLRKLSFTLNNENICRKKVTVRMVYLTKRGIIGELPLWNCRLKSLMPLFLQS